MGGCVTGNFKPFISSPLYLPNPVHAQCELCHCMPMCTCCMACSLSCLWNPSLMVEYQVRGQVDKCLSLHKAGYLQLQASAPGAP